MKHHHPRIQSSHKTPSARWHPWLRHNPLGRYTRLAQRIRLRCSLAGPSLPFPWWPTDNPHFLRLSFWLAQQDPHQQVRPTRVAHTDFPLFPVRGISRWFVRRSVKRMLTGIMPRFRPRIHRQPTSQRSSSAQASSSGMPRAGGLATSSGEPPTAQASSSGMPRAGGLAVVGMLRGGGLATGGMPRAGGVAMGEREE